MKKIIIICGPTATGKTDLAFNLAKYFNTEIISADSRQIYKYLNIGTAKPDKYILNNIKHHLIDFVSPCNYYSAGQFVFDSESVIKSMDTVPIVCGGTGFYIRSLTDWSLNMPSDKKVKEKIMKDYNKYGLKNLYQKILDLDKEEAENINPNDKARIFRTLEILFITNDKMSNLKVSFKNKKFNYLKICIMLPRNVIYDNINFRVDKMIQNGLVEETKNILKMGFSIMTPGLNTIGYKEIIDYLFNKLSLDEAIYKIKLNTRHYAKRQITWFKKEKNIIFCENNFDYIKELCKRFLK